MKINKCRNNFLMENIKIEIETSRYFGELN